MGTDPRIGNEEYRSVDGRLYEILGPTDTRTATHLIYGGYAYPLTSQDTSEAK